MIPSSYLKEYKNSKTFFSLGFPVQLLQLGRIIYKNLKCLIAVTIPNMNSRDIRVKSVIVLATFETLLINRLKHIRRPMKLRIPETDFGIGQSSTDLILYLPIAVRSGETLKPSECTYCCINLALNFFDNQFVFLQP